MNGRNWIGGLTRRERRAISVLLLVVVLQLSFNRLWPSIAKEKGFDYSEYSAEIESYFNSSPVSEPLSYAVREVPRFDVNKISAADLVSYGLSEGIAKRWLKYGEAINGFRNWEQIEEIYGLDNHWVELHRDKFIFTHKSPEPKEPSKGIEEDAFLMVAFDINVTPISDLKSMGFSAKSIDVISALRVTGERLDSKDDVKYLKGMHPRFYEKIEPFLIVDEPSMVEEEVVPIFSLTSLESNPVSEEPLIIDVNSSNEYQWQELNGIGPHFARSIVRYRQLLGGFTSLEQIKETYNLPDSVYQKIRPNLQLTAVSKQIDINRVIVDSLRKHPYIKWKQANIIINYRDQHGPFSSMNDFYKIRIFDSTWVERIEPYISFR